MMKKYLVGVSICLMFCSTSTLDENFDKLELLLSDEPGHEGFIEVNTILNKVSYSIEDSTTCEGSFDIANTKIQNLRDIVQGVSVSSEPSDMGNQVFHGIIVDGETFEKSGDCTGGPAPCKIISVTDLCKIQTFFKNFLEQSGEDLSDCPSNIYNPLMNC